MLDLLLASMFLILLGMAIVSLIGLLNAAATYGQAGAPVIDLRDKLNALTAEGDRPEWVYVMHFSTFAPSLVHFAIMLYAAPVALLPRRWNEWAAGRIDAGLDPNSIDALKIILWQALRWTVPVAFVTFAGWHVVSFGAGAETLGFVGRAFLWPVERYAELIGAV